MSKDLKQRIKDSRTIFTEVQEKAIGEMLSVLTAECVAKCEKIMLANQKIDDTYHAGKKAGAFACMGAIAKVFKTTIDYAWECNECGSQENVMAISEDEVQKLGCGHCGASEWHKAIPK